MSASSPDVTITVSLSFDRFHPPLPIADLGQINAVLDDVLMMLGQFIAHELLEIGGAITELGLSVFFVLFVVFAVVVVALFLVAAHVQVGVIGAAIGETMDQPRIAVIREDDGLVGG